jgi:hypothetical protein
MAASGRQRSARREKPPSQRRPFGEELKEIHAATDPSKMLASKQEVSASPPSFKPTIDTKKVELVAGEPPRPPLLGQT